MPNEENEQIKPAEDSGTSIVAQSITLTDVLLPNLKVFSPILDIHDILEQQHHLMMRELANAIYDKTRPAYNNALMEIAQQVQGQLKNPLADLVNQILNPLVSKLSSDFGFLLKRLATNEAQALATSLRNYLWWPVPGLPDEFYDGMLELIEQKRTRQINRYFCDWFSWWRYRRLGRLVRRWDNNPHFQCRRHIYINALQTHRCGWYNVSIPALLPLIEGIAVDYLAKELSKKKKGEEAIRKALNQNLPTGTFESELHKAMVAFLADSTYKDTRAGKVLTSGYQLNRHGVLHGLHLKYGTEANSLRCFLWLETLYRGIEDKPKDIEWFN